MAKSALKSRYGWTVRSLLRLLFGKPLVIAIMSLIYLLGGCLTGDDRTSKRGSEVENEVYGVLVDGTGNPGNGAVVRAYPASGFVLPTGQGSHQSAAVDSVTADINGKYAFDNLPEGAYNLFAEQSKGSQGSLVAFIPKVSVLSKSAKKNLGVDTLRAPGSIKGRVTLGGAGRDGAMAYLPGSIYLAFSGANGEFRVTGVPAGRYDVHYLIPGFQAEADTGVIVVAGDTTALPDKELGYDTSLVPPAPTRVKVTFDTLTSVVRLEWSPIRVADLLGYLVYRDTSALSSPELLTAAILTDTQYLDKVADLALRKPPPMLTYRIVSVDSSKNISLHFSPPVQTVLASPASLETKVALSRLDGTGSRASIGDTLRVEVTYSSEARWIRQAAWWVAGSTTPARVHADSTHSGTDTLAFAWSAPGPKYFAVIVSDDHGPNPVQSFKVEVVMDPPNAGAGPDQEILSRDSVWLQGMAQQEFGSIVSFAWDVGATGVFQEAVAGSLRFKPMAGPGSTIPCVLRVVDDDGNSSLDTLLVKVRKDPPIASLGPDLFASASDTVMLQSLIRTKDIIRWEWDLGGQGRFEIGPADTFFIAPKQDTGRIPCILRVTSSNGRIESDTLEINLVADPPTAVIGATPFSVSAGDTLMLSAKGSGDQYGRIMAWEWKIGDLAGFVTGSGKDTAIIVPNLASELPCVLRVTDDDGHIDTAAMSVPTHPKGLWAKSNFPPFDYVALNFAGSGTGFGKVWFYGQDGITGLKVLTSSADFQTWEQFPGDSLWIYDRQPSSPVFELNGSLWMVHYNFLTNYNEFWSSKDGKEWVIAAQPVEFKERIGFTTLLFQGKVWIFAGVDGYMSQPVRDIWSSKDGLTWEKVADNLPMGPQQEPMSTVWNGKMWLFGGFDFIKGIFRKDIWSSPDGMVWTKTGEVPIPSLLAPVRFAAHNQDLWIVESGVDTNGVVGRAWHSKDGKVWSKNPDPPGFKPLEYPILMPLMGRLWLLGLGTESGQTEIWLAPQTSL